MKLQGSMVQVADPELYEYVQQVVGVGENVQEVPGAAVSLLEQRKRKANGNKYKIVGHDETDEKVPVQDPGPRGVQYEHVG